MSAIDDAPVSTYPPIGAAIHVRSDYGPVEVTVMVGDDTPLSVESHRSLRHLARVWESRVSSMIERLMWEAVHIHIR